MARSVTFKGSPLPLSGTELKVGDKIPSFKLTSTDMQELKGEEFKGKTVVILSVPSLDTPVCSMETKHFNEEASKLSNNVVVIAVSRDLPFAQKRWCGSEGVERVIPASDYKYRTFGKDYGVAISDWELLARAVFVADSSGVLRYVEYVPEISSEPSYGEALKVVQEVAK